MRNFEKLFFVFSAVLLVVGLAFAAGLYSGVKRNFVFHGVRNLIDTAILVFEERENLVSDGTPIHFLQPARQEGRGVTVNQRSGDNALILLSGFFEDGNELRLIERDGTIVARWSADFSTDFPDTSHLEDPPATDWNIDTHGALINADGSVVFNYDYGGTVKLSRCGETVWTLTHPTHHSVERAEAGGYWIPGRDFLYEGAGEGFSPFTRQGTDDFHSDDLILKVSEDGEILEEVSVMRILYDSGLEPLMTATGFSFYPHATWQRDLVHLNKIEELTAAAAGAFPMFEAGDLMLSLRMYNMVLVVDPNTWRVKWHQTGPWRRQHDPEFVEDGTILVFNNNTYHVDLDRQNRGALDTPRVSEIVRMDPATREAEVVYGNRPGEVFLTVIRGKHQQLGDGVLVTEFEAGRVFEVDEDGAIVWEYLNRYDETQVLEITEARLYPRSYFSVTDWSCS